MNEDRYFFNASIFAKINRYTNFLMKEISDKTFLLLIYYIKNFVLNILNSNNAIYVIIIFTSYNICFFIIRILIDGIYKSFILTL